MQAEESHINVDIDPAFGYNELYEDGTRVPFPPRPPGLESFATDAFTRQDWEAGRFGPPDLEKGYYFRSSMRVQMIDAILRKNKKIGGAGLNLTKMVYKKQILFYTPLHHTERLEALRERWLHPSRVVSWWWRDWCGLDTGHIPQQNRVRMLDDIRVA